MEKNSKFMKKLINLFWILLYTFPLWYFIIQCIMICTTNTRVNYTFETFDNTVFQSIYNNFGKVIYKAMDNSYYEFSNLVSHSVIQESSIRMFKILFNTNSTGTLFNYFSFVLSWYVYMQLFHILVDVILVLPNIMKKFIHKIGGNVDE